VILSNFNSSSLIRVRLVASTFAIVDFYLAALSLVLWDKNATLDQTSNKTHSGEIILATEFLKANNAVDCDTIFE